MHHFFVDLRQIEGQKVRITGADVNHIRNVLRMKPGEEILISDGKGRDLLCQVCQIGPIEVLADVIREEESRELPASVTLYQGLPKSDKLELIIQKAVELGAARIVPVVTKNVVVRLEPKKEESRRRRWQAIAESAAKQSKRSRIPEVSRVLRFAEALKEASDSDVALFAYEHQKGMAETKKELAKAAPGQRIALFIGPEGGFDDAEVRRAEEAGVRSVSLGKRILRTETAGSALLSMLMLELEIKGEERQGALKL